MAAKIAREAFLASNITEIERILSEDVVEHLNQTIDYLYNLTDEFDYNSTCDVGCAVTQVLDLADDATRYINTTSREDILSMTTSAIDDITDLGKGVIKICMKLSTIIHLS